MRLTLVPWLNTRESHLDHGHLCNSCRSHPGGSSSLWKDEDDDDKEDENDDKVIKVISKKLSCVKSYLVTKLYSDKICNKVVIIFSSDESF